MIEELEEYGKESEPYWKKKKSGEIKTTRCRKCLIYFNTKIDKRKRISDTRVCPICNPDITIGELEEIDLIKDSLRIERKLDRKSERLGVPTTRKTKSKRYE